MKRLLMTLGLSLTLMSPAQASQVIKKQPTVAPYSLAVMGCNYYIRMWFDFYSVYNLLHTKISTRGNEK